MGMRSTATWRAVLTAKSVSPASAASATSAMGLYRITGQVEDNGLVAELLRLVCRELKHLRLAGRNDVPTGRERQMHGFKHLQLGFT